jgi:hypothetical protein
VPGAGGHGVRAEGSLVAIHGGVGNATSGANAFPQANLGTAGSAVSLDGASGLIYGVDAALSGGAGAASLPPAAPISSAAGSFVDARGERLPTVSITPASVSLGSTLTVRISGEPAFPLIRAVAFQTVPIVPVTGALGAVFVDLSGVFLWHYDTLDATGNLTGVGTIPQDPALANVSIVEQAAQLLPSGIFISPPVTFTFVP